MRPIEVLLAASLSGATACSLVVSAAPSLPRRGPALEGRPGEAAARARAEGRIVAWPVRLAESAGHANTPELEVMYFIDPIRSKAGWVAVPRGVQLVSSHADGPFPTAGVAVRSIVLAVDGRPVVDEREFIAILQDQPPDAGIDVAFLDPQGEPREARVELADASRRLVRFRIPLLVNYERDPLGNSSLKILDLGLVSLFEARRDGNRRSVRIVRAIEFGGD